MQSGIYGCRTTIVDHMFNKKKTFRGGYTFKSPDVKSSDTVDTAPIPEKVTIPLRLRFSSTIKPLVQKGDTVKAGQIIARDDDTISTPAIASVNGVVEDIRQIDYYYGKTDAMVIKSDGSGGYLKVEGASEDFEKLTAEAINELLYVSGATALGKSGIPTTHKSSPAVPKSIDNLMITTFNTVPFSLEDKVLLKNKFDRFYNGVSILKRVLPNVKVTIVMDRKDRVFIDEMADIIRRKSAITKTPDWIFIQPVDKKYPQESEDMLVRTLLERKIPMGGLGTDIGVLILEVQDVLQVYEAVAEGKPLIERTIAITGSACKEGKYISLRIGTSIQDALKGNIKDDVEPRVLFGNSLSGLLQQDLSIPVGRSIGHITVLEENRKREFQSFMKPGFKSDSYSNAFVSSAIPSCKVKYDTNMHGELRPCIQCSYCQDVCPVQIIPHLLSKQIKHDICEETDRLGIFDCIDCGLCSYVCPSKIPLADDIYRGKKKLIEDGCTVQMVKVKESEEAVKSYRGRMPL